MTPEVAQLRALASDDEQRRPATQRCPAFPGSQKFLPQPQLAERCAQAFPDDATLLQPDFVNSVVFVFLSAISQIVDQEDTDSRQGEKCFPCPLLHQVRGNHSESSEWI